MKLRMIGIFFLIITVGAGAWAHDETTGIVEHDVSHTTVYAVPAEAPQPSVTVYISEDPLAGWNVHAVTENFLFTPENSGMENVMGTGHAHIYIDGEKIGRMYGEWYYIPALGPGEHAIKVSLNGNNHQPYYANGKLVEGYAQVNVKEEQNPEVEEAMHATDALAHTDLLIPIVVFFAGLGIFAFMMGISIGGGNASKK